MPSKGSVLLPVYSAKDPATCSASWAPVSHVVMWSTQKYSGNCIQHYWCDKNVSVSHRPPPHPLTPTREPPWGPLAQLIVNFNDAYSYSHFPVKWAQTSWNTEESISLLSLVSLHLCNTCFFCLFFNIDKRKWGVYGVRRHIFCLTSC